MANLPGSAWAKEGELLADALAATQLCDKDQGRVRPAQDNAVRSSSASTAMPAPTKGPLQTEYSLRVCFKPNSLACTIRVEATFDVPPSVLWAVLTNPDNAAVFSDIKAVTERKVLARQGPQWQLLEVEQVGEAIVLWQRHDVRTRLRVEEDARDPGRLVQRFDLAASNVLKQCSGSWTLQPVRAAHSGRVVGVFAVLEQTIKARGLPSALRRMPLVGRTIRRMSLRAVHQQLVDIMAVTDRVKSGMGVQQALAEAAAERRALNPSFAAAAAASAAAARSDAAAASRAPLKAAAPDSFALQLGDSDDEEETGVQLAEAAEHLDAAATVAAAAAGAGADSAAAPCGAGKVHGKQATLEAHAAVLLDGEHLVSGSKHADLLAMAQALLAEAGEDVEGEQWEGSSDEYYCGSLSSSGSSNGSSGSSGSCSRTSMDGMPVTNASSSKSHGICGSSANSSSSSDGGSNCSSGSGSSMWAKGEPDGSSSSGGDGPGRCSGSTQQQQLHQQPGDEALL